MLSLSPLAHSLQFSNPLPRVRVTDVKSNDTNLTTYTFTACNLGDFGSVASIADTFGTNPHVRSPGRKAVAVIVHGEDAQTNFSVNSVTIGAVAGTERADRGGGTNAINTAIYTWTTDSLQNITSTDIVVTWSEAVTACAIGVLLIENLGVFGVISSQAVTNTGATGPAGTPTIANDNSPLLMLMGTTCSAQTETLQLLVAVAAGRTYAPVLLYEGSSAEIAFGAAFSVAPHYGASEPCNIFYDWSGAGAHDSVGILMY